MNNQELKEWCRHYGRQPFGYFTGPLVMGIINVTPDSFSDGGRYFRRDDALQQARRLIDAGADLLDIGAESSRPGASPVSVDEELTRIMPLLESLRAESDVCLSIDTIKPEVMETAVSAGAGMINDITALQNESALAVAVRLQVPVCLMHMQGTPRVMQENPHYPGGVVEEVNDFFRSAMKRCQAAGLSSDRLILDPGFGFGKTVRHNLQLMKHFGSFTEHKRPVMLGASRKSTLGVLVDSSVDDRLGAGIGMHVIGVQNGAAIIRTHDVKETKQALRMVQAVAEADRSYFVEGVC